MSATRRVLYYAWIVRAQLRALTRPDPARWVDGTRSPVVLLPGVWETWHVLSDLADVLHRNGHPVHVVPGLRANSAPLEIGAALLERHLVARDLRDVVVVAHSKGGLVAKTALARPEVSSRVRGVVAVASPFDGSVHATWFPSPTIRRLSPRDPVLRALAADRARNSRIVALRPSVDPHVPGSGDLPGAENVVLPLEGHFAPLGSPLLHAAVLRAVRSFDDGEPEG